MGKHKLLKEEWDLIGEAVPKVKYLPDAPEELADIPWEQVSNQLNIAEGEIKDFLKKIDIPLNAVDNLVTASADMVDKMASGERLTLRDIRDLPVYREEAVTGWNKAYSAYAGWRDALKFLADTFGVSWRRPSKRKEKVPQDLSRVEPDEIVNGLERSANAIQKGLIGLANAGARALQLIRANRNNIEQMGYQDLEAMQNMVNALMDFRDLVSTNYYAPAQGLVRRVDAIIDRLRLKEPAFESRKVSEQKMMWMKDPDFREEQVEEPEKEKKEVDSEIKKINERLESLAEQLGGECPFYGGPRIGRGPGGGGMRGWGPWGERERRVRMRGSGNGTGSGFRGGAMSGLREPEVIGIGGGWGPGYDEIGEEEEESKEEKK